MELALNLGWVVLATAMCWLWVHHAPREGSGRRMQFIALALVLVMMFTVITMYDDMAWRRTSPRQAISARGLFRRAYTHLHASGRELDSTAQLSRTSFQGISLCCGGQSPVPGIEGCPLWVPFRIALLPLPDHSLSSAEINGLIHFLTSPRIMAQRMRKLVYPTRSPGMGRFNAACIVRFLMVV